MNSKMIVPLMQTALTAVPAGLFAWLLNSIEGSPRKEKR